MTRDTRDNVTVAQGHVTPDERASAFGHQSATVWLTGLSGSGKSTLAFAVEAYLVGHRVHAVVLDGDNLRQGLNADLGFSPADRTENIRRVGHVSRLLVDAGLVVLASFISPYRQDRDFVRKLHPEGRFIEVFLSTSVQVCEKRDVKGLYSRARAGDLIDFSGVSAPYEAPVDPELSLDTAALDIETCRGRIVEALASRGIL